MKKIINNNRNKEYDTQTLPTSFDGLSKLEHQASEDAITKIYEPRPLTPDDDIYEDIIEQFASAPTKPKYWFEEFGDYWSCSCGHINKGARCKSCGIERELLRSLFILHKPANAPGELNKKLKKAKAQVDQEEEQQAERDRRRLEREAAGEDMMVIPIEKSEEPEDETPELPLEENLTEETEPQQEETITPENTDVPQVPQHDPDSALHEKNFSGCSDSLPETKKAEKDAPTALIVKPPSDIKVAETIGEKPKKNRFKLKIIIAIIVCFVLVVAGGLTIYYKMAAPAMQYEEAQQLQEAGKYKKAIEKYEALGSYKDSKNLIWECWIGIGNSQYDEGLFEEAIKTYEYVLEKTENVKMTEKIRQCHIAIGDSYMDEEEYEKALSSYATAMEMGGSEELQDKINDAKFAYVEAYKDDRTSQVEKYMDELRGLDYEGIDEIYDEYYAWKVKVIANTSAEDYSTDISTASRKDTVYFHSSISGGEPDETLQVYYEVVWPNGQSEIYNVDSSWESGSKITARFQYSMPLFGKEGTLTFKLYNLSTHEILGSDSITFKN